MGKKVLVAKSGRAACSCAAAGGGIAAKNAKSAKSFLTGLTGFTGLREVSVKPAKTKPSGVAWLGDIPDGWEVVPIRYYIDSFFSGVWGNEANVEQRTITCYRIADFDYARGILKSGPFTDRSYSESEIKGKLVLYGDLLLEKSGGGDSSPVGRVIFVNRNDCATCSNFIQQMRCRTLSEAKYLRYIFNALYSRRVNGLYYNQTIGIQNLKVSKYLSVKIPLPPLAEQRAIAAYLDEKCGAIDAAVAEAKKGIEEYKAWKKSLIFEVVTGKRRVGFFNAESKCARDEVVGLPERSEPEGLQRAARRRGAESFSTGLTRFTGLGENLDNPVNPVKTKPSGIPWIGDVPVGWEVSRVKHHYELILGKMLCATSNNDANVRLPYVCAANVHFEGVALSDLKEMWFSTIEVKQYAIREGDLLVVEGGAGAGGAAICPRIDGIVGIQNSIILVRNKSCRDNRYLRYLLEALVKNGYVDFVCNKATIPHFTKDKLGNVPLPLPPLPEQQAIAAYLDEKCGAIDEMVAEKEALIADLEAYKKSLIYETVTGKREVASNSMVK